MRRLNHFWISLLALVLVTIPTLALADGEPGAQCPGCDIYKCQYIAPPYTGTIMAAYKETCNIEGTTFSNCILIKSINGPIKQVGKEPGCEVNFEWTFLGAPVWMGQQYFQNLTPSDLRGSCLIELMEFGGGFGNCIVLPGYPELLAVGNMKYGTQPCLVEGYTAENCLTADVVIMQVIAM